MAATGMLVLPASRCSVRFVSQRLVDGQVSVADAHADPEHVELEEHVVFGELAANEGPQSCQLPRRDLDRFLPEGNAFLAEGLIEPAPRPITRDQVERYIVKDVATWRLTRSLRAVENMLQGQRGAIETIRRIHRIWTRPIF